ncbi:CG13308, partial [Drosophila busckii]
MLRLVLALFAIAEFLSPASAQISQCNACNINNNIACVSNTEFRFCGANNLPGTGPTFTCPTGSLCTGNTAVCEAGASVVGACAACQQCNSQKFVACLGVRTYALCLGASTPDLTITGSCAPNYVCNRDNPNICGLASQGSQATCGLADDELYSSTTESTPENFNATLYCQRMQRAGRFPRGTNINTTCRQFVLCFYRSNELRGSVYDCPGQTYFNATSALCVTGIPATCTVGIQYLAIQGL